ncbi:kinase-like protein [Ceratobasidium sp. AG-I]|nr:kinase-like protein [Ceratobasidium sp. AG-I]
MILNVIRKLLWELWECLSGIPNTYIQRLSPWSNGAACIPRNVEEGANDLTYSDAQQKVPSLITTKTHIDEVMDCLVQHDCWDITDDIDFNIDNEYITRGGFGTIYSGQLRDGRPVVIKYLEVLANQSWPHEIYNDNLKHTARELHTWSKCDHPGILPLLGMARFRGRIAMVSPLMLNGRLDFYIARNPSINRIEIAIQIAEALAYLHKKGIIHGDMKAANVLVSEKGHPKLADFGNAVVTPCTLEMTPVESFGCSIRWAAPEVLDVGSEGQTTHADVYALGMTLLEIFTGQLPYAEMSERAVVCTVVVRKELPPRPHLFWLPADKESADKIWKLLIQCWARDPDTRPTASCVRNQLVKIEQGIDQRATLGL